MLAREGPMRPRPAEEGRDREGGGHERERNHGERRRRRVDGRSAVHRVGGGECTGRAGRDQRRQRQRLGPLAQGGRGEHVGGVDRGRAEREQGARRVDRAQPAARDEQPDAAHGERERRRPPAREALAAEHDGAGHDEHRVAVGDDSGRPGSHPLDRGEVERGGRCVRRRAERDGRQARCPAWAAGGAARAARARARSRPARSGSPATWWCQRARAAQARRALRPNRTPRHCLRTRRDRGARCSPAGSLRAQSLVGAIGAAEQQKQGDQGVRHDRLLGKVVWVRGRRQSSPGWGQRPTTSEYGRVIGSPILS